jgi:hypothetical protein
MELASKDTSNANDEKSNSSDGTFDNVQVMVEVEDSGLSDGSDCDCDEDFEPCDVQVVRKCSWFGI